MLPSVTITILDCLFLFLLSSRRLLNQQVETLFGRITKQAPEARLTFKAKLPEFLPITSMKNNRLCELAVSLILSTDSTIVSNTVLYQQNNQYQKHRYQ